MELLQDRHPAIENTFKLFTDEIGLFKGDGSELFSKLAYYRFEIYDDSYWDDDIFESVLTYFEQKLVPHKIHVFNAGIELMATDWFKEFNINEDLFRFNLWLHDLSKFSHIEALPYATHDFSSNKYSPEFQRAWVHHKNKNEHHPEFWLNPNRKGKVDPLPMPDIYILEMFADWIGAGKTYGDELETWLPKNFHTFKFHPETEQKVKKIAKYLNIEI